MVSAELAAALPAVLLLCTLLLSALVTAVDLVRCADAARVAARAAARGDGPDEAQAAGARSAPAGALVRVSQDAGGVSVEVTTAAASPLAWLGLQQVRSTAFAQVEHSGQEVVP